MHFFPVTTRDFIRTVVLKTNPYWPFSRLNEVPYKIAIQAFAGLGKKFPEIMSVYLRRPLIKGNWTPGLSDIDLGVVIDSRLTLEEEFSFLHSFWKDLKTLKKYFPMLGEIEILNDDDIASWIKFGLEGYLSRNWTLLYGKETGAREIPVNPRKLAIESLHNALRFYLGYFQDQLNPKHARPYLVSRDLQRIAAKILRCLNYPKADQNGKPIPLARFEDKTAMICYIIKELEKSIRSSRSWGDATGSEENVDREGLTNIVSRHRICRKDQTFDIGALASCREAIQIIIMDFQKKIFIILMNGLDSATVMLCIDSIGRRFAGADKMPIIMSQPILNYMLRYYDPFQYADFVSRGTVAYGEDLLSAIHPPDKVSFVHNSMGQTATAL
ncbi:hypothetical protein L0244_34190, partial [bacterium]|nr:hypothetical protein [bacterium]